MEEKIYYLDNCTTKFLSPDVYKKMLETFAECQASSASTYDLANNSYLEIKNAREKIAKAINADENEIFFTSSGSESNALAIKGVAKANKDKGNHIIVSQIEHPSILKACEDLKEDGFEITYIPVDEFGTVDYAEIIKSISPKTILISITIASGEVGTFQPIRAIAELANQNSVLLHTDASSALGAINIDVKQLGVNLLTISSHKIGGPKGMGALFVKNGTKIKELISGEESELGVRAGIENVGAIAGFGVAAEQATSNLDDKIRDTRVLRKYFQKQLSEAVHNIALIGHPIQRIPSLSTIFFEGAEAEAVVAMLATEGIYASAANDLSLSGAPSKALLAMKIDPQMARSCVKFSITTDLTKDDIDIIVEKIRKCVKKVRSISAVRIYRNKVEL